MFYITLCIALRIAKMPWKGYHFVKEYLGNKISARVATKKEEEAYYGR